MGTKVPWATSPGRALSLLDLEQKQARVTVRNAERGSSLIYITESQNNSPLFFIFIAIILANTWDECLSPRSLVLSLCAF